MVFGKVIKNKAYFKRFQVKYRRRRAGKTDYRQRLKLVRQDKNKYSSPKYRLCVRITNKDVICQIFYATITGDICVASAYSHELPRYGLSVGLSNYSAAYATGLLIARRVLKKYGLDETYAGCEDPDGEDYAVEPEGDKKPFRCLLDIGLSSGSRGCKVWGALKGACDGGLDIPHNEKRYPGYDPDDKTLDAEDHCRYLFGQHVAEFMAALEEDDPELYNKQFKSYVKAGLGSDDLEDLYSGVHEKIREDPSPAPKKVKTVPAQPKKWKKVKLTYEERKEALKQRLAAIAELADE